MFAVVHQKGESSTSDKAAEPTSTETGLKSTTSACETQNSSSCPRAEQEACEMAPYSNATTSTSSHPAERRRGLRGEKPSYSELFQDSQTTRAVRKPASIRRSDEQRGDPEATTSTPQAHPQYCRHVPSSLLLLLESSPSPGLLPFIQQLCPRHLKLFGERLVRGLQPEASRRRRANSLPDEFSKPKRAQGDIFPDF